MSYTAASHKGATSGKLSHCPSLDRPHISPHVALFMTPGNRAALSHSEYAVLGMTKSLLTLVVRKYVSKLTSSLKSISKVFLGFLLRVSLSDKWSTAEEEEHERGQKIVTLHTFSRGGQPLGNHHHGR